MSELSIAYVPNTIHWMAKTVYALCYNELNEEGQTVEIYTFENRELIDLFLEDMDIWKKDAVHVEERRLMVERRDVGISYEEWLELESEGK